METLYYEASSRLPHKKVRFYRKTFERKLINKGRTKRCYGSESFESEIDSLQVCEETIDKNYKVIPDEKLLTNILKRKLTEEEKSSVKRPCVKK